MKNFITKYDIITRLVALIAAFILWIWVMDVKNPIRTVTFNNIVVDFTAENIIETNHNLIVISEDYPKVKLEFKGTNDIISRLSADSIDAELSLAGITKPGEYVLDYTVSLPFSGLEISDQQPSQITVVIDELVVKDFPIEMHTTGDPSTYYVFEDLNLTDTITVTGPSNEVNNIASAYIEVDITDTTEDINGNYEIIMLDINGNIVKSDNIQRNKTSLEVYKPIQKLKSVPVNVELIYGSVVPEKAIESYELNKTQTTLIGTPEEIDKITSVDLGVIYVDEVSADNTMFVFEGPKLAGLEYYGNSSPIFIVNFTLTDYTSENFTTVNIINYEDDEIVFSDELLEKYDLLNQQLQDEFEDNQSDDEVNVDDIEVLYPEVSLVTSELLVKIYGSQKELDTLYPQDIIIEPDFDGVVLEEGLNDVPCKITIMSNYVFDILEEYQITVEVN